MTFLIPVRHRIVRTASKRVQVSRRNAVPLRQSQYQVGRSMRPQTVACSSAIRGLKVVPRIAFVTGKYGNVWLTFP